ncbi:MAG TPA: alpha-amylase/4-alpha-glucanotransferase domain-containing protein [Gemmatimonadales bacterium]|jgi:hypothetical protein
MSEPLRFCLALHLHQPVGNFDSVFEQHLRDVYRPLVTALMDGELAPVTMHISGPLLEWLDAHAPDFVDLIGIHARDGRIELICAGHDEPILAVLPPADRLEQIGRHREWMQSRFGVDTRGLWLTERVWEPTLPETLAQAGVNWVLVDDRHFRVTGFSEEQLHTHYVSESGGHRVRVFPIDEKLRYLIPFRPPVELADYFAELRQRGHEIAVLGDDGEKFGGWPGTLKWLYEDGWLQSFLGTMRELRDRGEVIMSRFDDAIRYTHSGGLAYLPTASYREMEGWSLPFEPSRALLRLERAWEGPRLDGVDGGLLRGGHWRHFFVKYPESNRMHKHMLELSTRCRAQGDPTDARRAIGRAQCNDSYWHGVFGGLYLPFLRGAVWQQLAIAEGALRAAEAERAESIDIDMDGHDELWLHGPRWSVTIAPRRGAMIDVWLDLMRHENNLNVLARHREAYHEPLDHDAAGHAVAPDSHADAGGAPSIHALETELTVVPPVDVDPRGLLVDRILRAATTVDDFSWGSVAPHRNWADQAMRCDAEIGADATIVAAHADDLDKTIRLRHSDGAIECAWRWDPARFPADAWFSSELSFSTPLRIDAPGAERWEYVIETVSKSEAGFDRSAQGVAVVLRWPVSAGNAAVTIIRSDASS